MQDLAGAGQEGRPDPGAGSGPVGGPSGVTSWPRRSAGRSRPRAEQDATAADSGGRGAGAAGRTAGRGGIVDRVVGPALWRGAVVRGRIRAVKEGVDCPQNGSTLGAALQRPGDVPAPGATPARGLSLRYPASDANRWPGDARRDFDEW